MNVNGTRFLMKSVNMTILYLASMITESCKSVVLLATLLYYMKILIFAVNHKSCIYLTF